MADRWTDKQTDNVSSLDWDASHASTFFASVSGVREEKGVYRNWI